MDLELAERPREASPGRVGEYVLVSALLSIALVIIFAPWRATALELRDFSEFLPLLESRPTFTGQWQVINDYYRTQGRGNVLTNGLIVAGWHVAGTSPARWQAYELGFLIVLAISLFAFLRARGVARAVAVGLAMWTACSGGPAAGALRLSAELPIAVLLIATIWLSRDRLHRKPAAAAIALAALVAAVLLFKEAAFVFLPVVAGAVLSGRGRPSVKVVGVAVVTAVAALVLARAFDIAGRAPRDAYSQGLNLQHANVFAIVAAARLASPDHWPWMSAVQPLTSWATLAWLGVVVVGCAGAAKRGGAAQVAGLVVTCAGGLALYSAWGRFESFYAAPFVVVQAVTAGDGLVHRPGRAAWAPIVTGVIIVIGMLHAVTGAWRLREWTVARRAVEFEAAETISRLGPNRPVTIVADAQPAQAWQGNAATYARFVRSMWPDRTVPVLADARCAEAATQGVTARVMLVYDVGRCEGVTVTGTIRRDFRAISVIPPRWSSDAYVLGTAGLD